MLIDSIEELKAIIKRQRNFFFQQSPTVSLSFEKLTIADNELYKTKINKELSACGCETAGIFSCLSIISYIILVLNKIIVKLPFISILLIGIIIFILMGFIGKIIGQYSHRYVLSKTINELIKKIS